MRRHPLFDPPEYRSWTPDPSLLRLWLDTLQAHPSREARVQSLKESDFLSLYAHLLRARLTDQMLARWVRQGKLSKAWLATGEEALTVGAVAALDPSRDWVCPILRNQAACAMMGMELAQVFRGWLATPDSPNGGWDLHIGSLRHHVLPPISSMGSNLPVLTGVALGLARQRQGAVALTWIGDGATWTGEFHEGLAMACSQRAPAIFIVQNNQVALGTPSDGPNQDRLDRLGEAYGLTSFTVDGNHVLDVWATVAEAAERCRAGFGPILIHGRTFRMGGHSTHDTDKARELFGPTPFRFWGARDPIGGFELWLDAHGIPSDRLEALEAQITAEIETAAAEAWDSRSVPRPHTGGGEAPLRGRAV